MAFKTKSSKPTKTVEDIITPEEEKFIGAAKADSLETTASSAKPSPEPLPTTVEPIAEIIESLDLHTFVKKHEWPITPLIMPSIAQGRDDLDKPFMLRMPETLWLSIERHCKSLGVSKSEWVRHAMLKLMREEQEFFSRRTQ